MSTQSDAPADHRIDSVHENVKQCPQLLKYDCPPEHRICRPYSKLEAETETSKVAFVLIFVLLGASFLIWLLVPWDLDWYIRWAGIIGTYEVMAVVAISIQNLIIRNSPRARREAIDQAARGLLFVIRDIELIGDRWNSVYERERFARRIDGIANEIEKLAAVVPVKDESIYRPVVLRARGVAMSLRRLETWLAMPEPSTRSELLEELTKREIALLTTGWWTLPCEEVTDLGERQEQRRKRRNTVALVIAACVLMVIGVLAAAVFPVAIAGVTAPLLLSTSIALFAKSGIDFASLSDTKDLLK